MEDIVIRCADKSCTGSSCDLVGRLQIIGRGLHCPYCRGQIFTLEPTAEAIERQKEVFKRRKEEAMKRREAEEKDAGNSV